MKKTLLSTLLIFMSIPLFIACSDDDDDMIIQASELPAAAQTFVSTHFETTTYRRVEKENKPDDNGGIYDVYLSNGFEIEFDINGLWVEIDGNKQPLPESIIVLLPEQIDAYVKTTYPTLQISGVEKKTYGFEIELINDLDLMFDKEGVFIRVDH